MQVREIRVKSILTKSRIPTVRQLKRAKKDTVFFSSVCDPYQPLEKKYKLTRRCLEVLVRHGFPVDILTKSDLVLRDLDLLRRFKEVTVGWSITTDRDYIKEIFEPASSPIEARLKAAQVFHDAGIETYAFIGPILPMDPEALAKKLIGKVEYVLIDKMNYPYKVSGLYKKHKLEKYLSDEFFEFARDKLKAILSRAGIEVEDIF